jgi:hypothetical protein
MGGLVRPQVIGTLRPGQPRQVSRRAPRPCLPVSSPG